MNDISHLEREFGSLDAYTTAPDWWLSIPSQSMSFIDSLKDATIRTIGTSSGGHEIIALEYGDKESLEGVQSDNLSSAIASKLVPPDPTEIFPPTFYGTNRRHQPVVVLQGGIHGSELTGTVASLNLCQIIETGCDARGKAWPRLAELARQTRICIIPWLNMDAVLRSPVACFTDMPSALSGRLSQGIRTNGEPYVYPRSKAVFPLPPEETAFMGTYFNDQGVNLQYDFTSVHRQPETTAWMEYYLAERPDGIVIWHCNAGSMMGPPCFYLPVGFQLEETRLAGAVAARLGREGHQHDRISWASLPGMGKPYMEQMTATYHVCGGTPLMVELPIGSKDYHVSLDDMLDIGLITIEETLNYAHTEGLRPYENWGKVKRRMKI